MHQRYGFAIDLLLLLTICFSVGYAYKLCKSISYTVLIVFLATSTAGIFCQISEALAIGINRNTLNVVIAVNFLVWAFYSKQNYRNDSRQELNRVGTTFFLSCTLFVIFGTLLSRFLASQQEPFVLTQFAFLARSEDNGGWLDVSSNLISGGPIAFEQAGGPLVAFLSICQSISRIIVFAITGNENDLSSILNSVVIAYLMLFILSAASVASFLQNLSRLSKSASVILGFSIWIMIFGALLMAQDSGHLSFIFVAVVYSNAIWQISFSKNMKFPERHLYIFSMVIVQPVWLPLHLISLIMAVWLIQSLIKDLLNQSQKEFQRFFVTLVVIFTLAIFYFAFGAINYTTNSVSQAKNIIGASGGVGNPSTVLMVLFAISLLFIALLRSNDRNYLHGPIGYGICYVFLFIGADYWLTGTMNYGTTKLLLGLLILFAPLSVALLFEIFISNSKREIAERFVLHLAVSMLILGLIDGSTQSIFGFMSPLKWPVVTDSQKETWQDAVRIDSAAMKLEHLPIGCVTRDTSGDIWVDGETYACSRQLSSISGVWGENWMLIEFQLWPDRTRIDQLKQVPFELMGRKLLILDSVTHEVVGEIKVEDFKNYAIESY